MAAKKNQNKTRPTAASVAAYIAAILDAERRADCYLLIELMQAVAKEPPKMWGPGIIGFGSYHYRYDSGREGDMAAIGFSSRKDLAIYLSAGAPGQAALLKKLGKHKMGKSCLSIRRLSEVDINVLRQLVVHSLAETRRRYP